MSFFFGGPSSQALTSFTAFALITLHKEALSVNRYWLCEVNIPIIPIITLSLFCVWITRTCSFSCYFIFLQSL
jgi:hypothetical protein